MLKNIVLLALPGVAPFDEIAFNSGVQQLHAHNAWLDLWLQLGIVGVVVFGAIVLSSAVRSWLAATDRPVVGVGRSIPFSPVSLLPLLLLTALLVQSFAESRLLVEYGIVLLTIVAVKTRRLEVAAVELRDTGIPPARTP